MGTGQKRNSYVVKEAGAAMDKFKWEIANELNIDLSPVQGGYWGYMTTRDTGSIGGHMVRRMIEAAEASLAQQAANQVSSAFRQTLATPSQQQQQQQQQQFSGMNQQQ
ncbi:MAG TPA: alpha/beta-type small acid-soluble spore protein [Firmicutes bacterium]|jgi:hypothetical protein|nr:alpha/beta-type small acid-soluble spore protein [Bacillota bacterium]